MNLPPTLSGSGVFSRCLAEAEAAGAGGREPAFIYRYSIQKRHICFCAGVQSRINYHFSRHNLLLTIL